MHRGAWQRRKKSGGLHGARPSRLDGNAWPRCRGCACNWVDAPALAGSRQPGRPGSKTDMNAALVDLRVRWLGRMEFQRALELQEEIVLKKREDPSVEDQLLLLEHEPVYTIGRTPDRSSLSAPRRIHRGEVGTAHLPYPLF